MNIIKHVTRSLVENIYIVEINKKCFIVDPGYDFEGVVEIIETNKFKPEFIILTHGHGDHIGSAKELKEKYNIPIYAHLEEKELLNDPRLNLSYTMYGEISLEADRYLVEEDSIDFEGKKLKLFYTPGHTKGGMCILIDNHLFTGDTLFANSIGRSDFPTGDYEELINSIESKLLVLDDEIIVHPGHNSDSTIGSERINNPFLS